VFILSFFGADFFLSLFFLADFESNRGGYADSSNTASTQRLDLYISTLLIVDKSA
jgi:hypothetical protein